MKIDYTKYHKYSVKSYGIKGITMLASATIFTSFKEKLFEKITGKTMDHWFKIYGLNTHNSLIEEISDNYNVLLLNNGDIFYVLIPKDNETLNFWFRNSVTLPFKELKRIYPYWDRGISNTERKIGLASGKFSVESYTKIINGSSIIKTSKNNQFKLAELKSVLPENSFNVWDVDNIEMIGVYNQNDKTIKFNEYLGNISKEKLEDLLTLL